MLSSRNCELNIIPSVVPEVATAAIRDPEAKKIGVSFWIPDRPRSARPSGMTAGKTRNFRDDKIERLAISGMTDS
ncbi:hypothetical protein A2480_02390 [Candidatus Uhrbacteria bacterium RIFOXYC2_FULL_47_19]|uniref:Uncharacterized protein n=1 Tax=Candidatus Uhrbacteria bacterium RIFOXYC2_FULL_47_19 TaxID=1802424 RepID=A0A1F7WEZ0_9BACT|nr:MAG: hypothetical protein A2480_02390 [Candidatus Uhrbacteria bacterium RIFOXYC2_FULL_47_19]